jgi:hypothetical protein
VSKVYGTELWVHTNTPAGLSDKEIEDKVTTLVKSEAGAS